MTSLAPFLPVLIAAAVALVVTGVHRRLPGRHATMVITAAMVTVVIAALPTVWLLSLAFLAHVPLVGNGFQWCAKAVDAHGHIGAPVGVPASVLVIIGSWHAMRALRATRRLRRDAPGHVQIAEHDQPFAMTLPGRAGQVVVSSGLIDLLDEQEQQVVLAHEAAHGRYRHDRYLLVAAVASSAIPMLRPLAARLQFSLERWADEAAVNACGDRHLVAVTLGKVALSTPTPAGVLPFAGLGVAARVATLLGPPVRNPGRMLAGIVWASVACTATLAVFQLHHLAAIAAAFCPT